MIAEAGGQGYAQRALGLVPAGRHGGVGLLDVGQDSRTALVVGRAFVGQVEAAGGAVDQTHSQAGFERREASAHHRRGKPEIAPSCGKAAGGNHFRENRHFVECVRHFCIICNTVLKSGTGLAAGV